MAKIKTIIAREILDSRGIPTIESRVILDNNVSQSASSPAGPILDKYGAVDLRDNDPGRYQGLGVVKAVTAVNTIIAPKLVGLEIGQQGRIDKTLIDLDGTADKSRLGANSLLSVSVACAKAGALMYRLPLYHYIFELMKLAHREVKLSIPTPIFNMINGGAHGAGNLDFQEYHIIPATSKPYDEALRLGVEVYQVLKKVLITRNATYSTGEEGGFAPNLYTNIDALEALTQALTATEYKLGFEVFLGLDIAASYFKTDQGYQIKDRPNPLKAEEFVEYLQEFNKEYHLLLLEDPLADKDWEGWVALTSVLGHSLTIVGDDLLASNMELLNNAITKQACNGILVKPNQVGTVSETLQLIHRARSGGFKVIISHRSGETNDDFIADLSVGVGAEYVKFGAPVRGERVAKYNRLLEIHSHLSAH